MEESFDKYNHPVYSDAVIEESLEKVKREKLRVWYGVRKLNKIAKKKSIIVIFENAIGGDSEKNEKKMNWYMHVAHCRLQTEEEKKDSVFSTRVFTTYEKLIDQTFKGDYELALEHNSIDDQNHVSLEERLIIQEKLKVLIRRHYPDLFEVKTHQSKFNFNNL